MSVETREPAATLIATEQEGAAAVERGRHALPVLLRDVRLLLLSSWLGASLFFSFALAPSVFAILRDSTALYANHLAGTIVTRNLVVINMSGLIISLLLIAGAFVYRSRRGGRFSFVAEIIALAVVAVMTSVGHWVIAARMLALRAQMGRPIDETAATDPLRAAFNSLHVYSVSALTAAMVAALLALLIISRRAPTN